MSPRPGSLFLFLIRCAALLVPRRDRAEWVAEWAAELWHVRQAYCAGASFRGTREVVGFCLGAFQDAFWIRRHDPASMPSRLLRTGSASRCFTFLVTATATSLLLCLSLPGASEAMRRAFCRDADSLVMISRGGYSGSQSPTIGFEEYRSWR